jgi:hypothetical protein
VADLLPPIPREPMDPSRPESVAMWKRQFFEPLNRILGKIRGIAWVMVDKAGSKLSDLTERPHSQLQGVLGWESGADASKVRHISNAVGKVWQDHVDVVDGNPHGTDHSMLEAIEGTGTRHITLTENAEVTALDALAAGMVTKTGNAAYAPRSIQGTANEVAVSFGDGQSGNPTVSLPDRIEGPRSFGGETDKSTFETDGTLHFENGATVWKDIKFPMAPPKTTGAGNPTLVTFNGNQRGYSFAVNDSHDFNPEEIDHDGKVGSTATWHVHFLSRSNDGTDRYVKWEIEYSVEPSEGVLPAPTTISAEMLIPAGTAANTVQRLNIDTFVVPNIARLVWARVKRVAASGSAPSVDPVLGALHFHYELDTVGSREILTK